MRSSFWTAPLAAALYLAGCADGFHSVGFYDKVDTTVAGNRTVAVLGVGDLDGNYGGGPAEAARRLRRPGGW